MKTIVHYKNGQQHTVNHLTIWHKDWEGEDVSIYGELWLDRRTFEVKVFTDTFKDVLFLEEISKEDGVVKLYFNPNTDMSVKVDVMTAKQRAKDNRSDILSTVGRTFKGLRDSLYKMEQESGVE